MTTPLEGATLVLRRHLAKSISNPALLDEAHELVDDVIHEALIAQGGGKTSTYTFTYRGYDGEKVTIRELPGTIGLDADLLDVWRDFAELVKRHGGYEVQLHVTDSYGRVEDFDDDDTGNPPGAIEPSDLGGYRDLDGRWVDT